jgi:hypothetical protein
MSYGLKDYTGPGPIGGGVGYPSKYKESDAHQIIESLADLNLALVEYGQGKVVWIPNGVTITIPSVYSLSGRRILRDTIRCTIAADRSSGNGGRIKVTAKANGYMTGMWMASHSEIVGLTVEGPGAFEGTTPKFGYAGMCAFRSAGTKGILYENTEVKNFAQGGLKFSGGGMLWNDPERHIVRACEIHGSQRHGFGYGIAQAEANGSDCAVLVEASRIYDCRHLITCDHGTPYSYELRHNIFGDAWYRLGGDGAKAYACQIDAHGSGHKTSGHAGRRYEIHGCDFSANGNKANIGIRGIPADRFNIYANRTLKDNHSGLYPADGSNEVKIGQFVDLEGGEGGSWGGENNMPKYRVFVFDNWYGEGGPPEGPPETPDEPPVEVNTPDIQVASLDAPQVEVGQTYTITATVGNLGTAAGSADIVIGYMAGTTKRVLKTEAVELQPGEVKTVVWQATAKVVGSWTFYCGNKLTILKVVEPPPAAPVFVLSSSSVNATVSVSNTGNAEGTTTVLIGGWPQTVTVAPGESKEVTIALAVELS